jgi:hypothetical protein
MSAFRTRTVALTDEFVEVTTEPDVVESFSMKARGDNVRIRTTVDDSSTEILLPAGDSLSMVNGGNQAVFFAAVQTAEGSGNLDMVELVEDD